MTEPQQCILSSRLIAADYKCQLLRPNCKPNRPPHNLPLLRLLLLQLKWLWDVQRGQRQMQQCTNSLPHSPAEQLHPAVHSGP